MKTKFFTLLSTPMLLLCGAAMAQNNVVFMSSTGNNSNSGATWLLAKGPTYLQTLTGVAVPANTKIYIKTGTYTFSQANGIGISNGGFQIKGGYPTGAGATDTSGYDPVGNPTIINLSLGSSVDLPFLANPTASISSRVMGIQFVGPNSSGGNTIYYGTTGLVTTNFDFIDDIFSNFGQASSGGGWQPILTQNAGTYNFTNCVFHDNGAANDGAAINISSQSAVLNINKCSFYNNRSATGQQGGGGAVASVAPTNTITNSYFCNNSAPSGAGGAVGTGANSGGASVENFTITNCTFSGNSCGSYWGGAINIHSNSGSVLTMSGCNFYKNTSTGGAFGGGAVSFDIGQVQSSISNCNFYGNSITSATSTGTGQGGGAIMIYSNTSVTSCLITACVFDSNYAPNGSFGAAIMYNNGFGLGQNNNIRVDKCTFINNTLGGSTTVAGSDFALYSGFTNDGHYTVTNSKIQLSAQTAYKPVFLPSSYNANYNIDGTNTFNNTNGSLGSPTLPCPTTLTQIQILPVTFTGFTAILQGNNVSLSWATATETNNTGFAIERSGDGINFTQIAFVSSEAKNGASSSALNYIFNDANPQTGTSYYRLKQVDFDGNSTYSSIATVYIGAGKSLSLGAYPNPVASSTKVIVGGVSMFSSAYITIVNGIGQTVQRIPVSQSVTSVDFTALQQGMYYLIYRDGIGNQLQTKVRK